MLRREPRETTHQPAPRARDARRVAGLVAALTLAVLVSTIGCELIVAIDPRDIASGGASSASSHASGAGGAGVTTASHGSTTSSGTGGASSASSSASSSGTGGTGGCTTAQECAQPSAMTPCVLATCTTHVCGMADAPANQPAPASVQTAGNCEQVVCDGKGGTMHVADDSNVPNEHNPCIQDGCSAGQPTHTPLLGSACTGNGGKVCSAAGTCVACNVDADCATGFCQLNKCVTSHCNDGVQDGDETDVDCGGSCAPCGNYLKCLVDVDCQSDVCDPTTLTCEPPSCSDGVQNEGETDVDCGGPICGAEGKLCTAGEKCMKNGDCQSLDCPSGVCLAATCFDGIQNQDETDVDCGGTQCAPCPDLDKCLLGRDCIDKICDPTLMTCTPPTCSDGVQNGMETDVDCGGMTCDAMSDTCSTGEKCLMPADCTSLDCRNHVCLAATCSDGIQNEGETDVDCGGPNCPASCTTGETCVLAGDCVSGVCTGGTCQAPTCSDGVKNGNETDVDCGGGTCPACPVGEHCAVGSDCTQLVCSGSPATCQPPTCTDGVKNGSETGVDCGGTVCDGLGDTCGTGNACGVNGDCTSGLCSAGLCALRPDGQACTLATQCLHGNCVGTAGQELCCNTACSGTCEACTMALTGSSDGTCATITPGTPAPTGQCGPSGPCGNDGNCAAGGVCELLVAGTVCSSPTCAGGQLTQAGACNGTGSCNTMTAACPGGFVCATSSTCKTSCTVDADCAAAHTYCSAGACVSQVGPGVSCSRDDACTTGVCGTDHTGNCCGASCSPIGGACGATGCDTTSAGACVFPALGTTCGTPSCAGSTLTPAGGCDGQGACTPGTAAPCPNGLVCNDAVSCKTACASDADCASTSDYCANPGPSGVCTPKGGAGASCAGDDECTGNACGPTGTGTHCCKTSCQTTGACGASDCDTSGLCIYPTSATSCATAACMSGMLTPAGACDAMGGCSVGPAAACPNGLACASATACKSACASDADCASSTSFCHNPGPSGVCVADESDGTACGGNDECTSGVCGLSGTGNCCTMACSPIGTTCGATGCDATGACDYAPATTNCAAAACTDDAVTSSSSATAALLCDGHGSCASGTPTSCGKYRCNGSACATSCTSSAECWSPAICDIPDGGSVGTCM